MSLLYVWVYLCHLSPFNSSFMVTKGKVVNKVSLLPLLSPNIVEWQEAVCHASLLPMLFFCRKVQPRKCVLLSLSFCLRKKGNRNRETPKRKQSFRIFLRKKIKTFLMKSFPRVGGKKKGSGPLCTCPASWALSLQAVLCTITALQLMGPL